MIEVLALKKNFRHHQAVKSVSFTAPDGAITGLLGANGAGKTTTLRMISGLLQPTSGTVLMDGISCHATPRFRLGTLLDHTGIYARLTARENLTYFGALRGLSNDVLRQQVDLTLSMLGLSEVADRQAAGFSQGERMKVALGRALLHSPANLLLDEPTNALDIVSVRNLRTLLKEMRDAGMCIVFSSHVLEDVTALCDNIVILSQGTVAASGSADELCRKTGAQSLEEAFIDLTFRTEHAYA